MQSDVHSKCDFELYGNLHFLLLLFWPFGLCQLLVKSPDVFGQKCSNGFNGVLKRICKKKNLTDVDLLSSFLICVYALSPSICVVNCRWSLPREPPFIPEGGGWVVCVCVCVEGGCSGWTTTAPGLRAVNGPPLGRCYWESVISITAPLSSHTMATNKTLTWKWVKCT